VLLLALYTYESELQVAFSTHSCVFYGFTI